MNDIQHKSLLKLPEKVITRFAPSPTGYLHLGHVISLAYVFGLAGLSGGKVLLRMEDHDTERCRKEYEREILEDMAWMGFFPDNWEEFTQKKQTKYRQSDQFEVYEEKLKKLCNMNRVYACTCSRRQLSSESVDPDVEGVELPYPGTCRTLHHPIASRSGCRFKLDSGVETFDDVRCGRVEQKPEEQCGDFLLRDRRGCFTYNFAVVVDDIDQGVNFVVRGDDIFHCTGRQVALAKALGSTETPLYFHHPLALDSDGKKLSKRTLSEGIIRRRKSGEPPGAVIGEALWAAGVVPHGTRVKAPEVPAILKSYLYKTVEPRP